MLRQAAVLGVPAVSIFAALGAVDDGLSRDGRVGLVRTPDGVRRVRVQRRRPAAPRSVSSLVRSQIVQGSAIRRYGGDPRTARR
jgi:predicted glycosyltransferase